MIFPKKIDLNGLILKQPSTAYAQQLKELVCRNQNEFKYILIRNINTLARATKDLKSRMENWKNGEFCYFLFKGKQLIGYTGIKVRIGRPVAEISYYLDKDQTGNGYITMVVQKLEEIFFAQKGHRCEIFCNETNTRSCAVAERLNYRIDGVMREYELIDGVYQGVRIYSKLSSD